jgi:hypothetical protein
MPKTKISEFSATPANNTDIDSINLAEGCAPSGINDAIRELMSQLKDFQTGAVGDSFNGPVGSSTAAAGAFTTLSASSTVSGTGFSTYLASPPAIGGTAAAAGAFTTLAASGAVTLSGGTANGVTYLNGSKVVTSGSALTFDGTSLGIAVASPAYKLDVFNSGGYIAHFSSNTTSVGIQGDTVLFGNANLSAYGTGNYDASAHVFKTSNTEQMRLTSTGLGIGTSTITGKLSVKSGNGATSPATLAGTAWDATYSLFGEAGGGSTANFGIGFNGASISAGNGTHIVSLKPNSDWYPINYWANLHAWYGGGTQRMLLDTSGNLGLGVTPSAWSGITALQVKNASMYGSGNEGGIYANAYYNAGWKYIATATATGYDSNALAGGHRWYTAASGTAGTAISFTQAMTLTAGGNFVVGATSAIGVYDKNITVVGSGSAGLTMGNGTLQYAFGVNGSALQFYDNTASAERMRITSAGYLLVKTTNTTTVQGDSRFKVQGDAGTSEFFAVDTFGSAICTKSSTATQNQIIFTNPNGTVGTITTNGSATLYNVTSDQRLKENIVNAPDFGSVIDSLQVRSFDWKSDSTHQRAGFIAQELVTVAPEAVHQPTDTEQMMAVDYSKLVPMLVKEIQSLRQRLSAANL